jgi:hypothetical protein
MMVYRPCSDPPVSDGDVRRYTYMNETNRSPGTSGQGSARPHRPAVVRSRVAVFCWWTALVASDCGAFWLLLARVVWLVRL